MQERVSSNSYSKKAGLVLIFTPHTCERKGESRLFRKFRAGANHTPSSSHSTEHLHDFLQCSRQFPFVTAWIALLALTFRARRHPNSELPRILSYSRWMDLPRELSEGHRPKSTVLGFPVTQTTPNNFDQLAFLHAYDPHGAAPLCGARDWRETRPQYEATCLFCTQRLRVNLPPPSPV